MIKVSFVLPCLNEENTVAQCVLECKKALAAYGEPGEIIVADNGSTDRSVFLAESAGARVVHVKRRGYGAALQEGFRQARGEIVFMADSDMSYDFGVMPEGVRLLESKNLDMVMGSRFFSGKIEDEAMPWFRKMGNYVLSSFARRMFSSQILDFHCGLRIFRREKILALNLASPGMEFASEMILKAEMAGLKIGQMPITLRKDKRGKEGHLRPFRDGLRHVALICSLRLKSFLKKI